MGLVLNDLAARFSVAVHDQVPELVGEVEALAIVVTFDRVSTNWTQSAVKRVGVHRSSLRRAEDDQYAVVL